MIFELPLGANIVVFLISAISVWIAGTHLAVAAEEISDRKNLGKDIVGLIYLAAATELPEIVTTLFAALNNQASLLLNNMFGGVALQTAILALADTTAAGVAISRFPRKPTPILEGTLLIVVLALLHAVILVGDVPLIGHIGLGPVLLACLYIWIIYFLNKQDQRAIWHPVDLPRPPATTNKNNLLVRMSTETDLKLYQRSALATLAILVFGVLLVATAEGLAEQTGLGTSFIGATLLAGSTSLPELSTTVMAIRLHSYTMAISNIFGSNLIMVFLILPADIAFASGPVLQHADKSAEFAVVCGVIMTAVYVLGLTLRTPGRILRMGYDSLVVLAVYLVSVTILYTLR